MRGGRGFCCDPLSAVKKTQQARSRHDSRLEAHELREMKVQIDVRCLSPPPPTPSAPSVPLWSLHPRVLACGTLRHYVTTSLRHYTNREGERSACRIARWSRAARDNRAHLPAAGGFAEICCRRPPLSAAPPSRQQQKQQQDELDFLIY